MGSLREIAEKLHEKGWDVDLYPDLLCVHGEQECHIGESEINELMFATEYDVDTHSFVDIVEDGDRLLFINYSNQIVGCVEKPYDRDCQSYYGW